MSKTEDFLLFLVGLLLILGIGAVMAWVYYSLMKRDLFGGFVGGMVVAVIGALIGAYLLDSLLLVYVEKLLKFLVYNPARVDIIAGFLGAWAALYIMNRLNHDKTRKKY
jgi:uncharacterized membrane protein YeaQ/YmgE (transglycosylase-associated protein family)